MRANETQTFDIEAGRVAKIVSNALGTGQAWYFANGFADVAGPVIAPNSEIILGPFFERARIRIECFTGTVDLVSVTAQSAMPTPMAAFGGMEELLYSVDIAKIGPVSEMEFTLDLDRHFNWIIRGGGFRFEKDLIPVDDANTERYIYGPYLEILDTADNEIVALSDGLRLSGVDGMVGNYIDGQDPLIVVREEIQNNGELEVHFKENYVGQYWHNIESFGEDFFEDGELDSFQYVNSFKTGTSDTIISGIFPSSGKIRMKMKAIDEINEGAGWVMSVGQFLAGQFTISGIRKG